MVEPDNVEDLLLDFHAKRMARRKVVRDRIIASKGCKKGLIIIHTGTGKGKSSAAFGMVLRCIGHGMKVGIVQFIKGAWDTAERRVLSGFPWLVTFLPMGEGFTWETQNRSRDIASAQQALKVAAAMLADPSYRMVVLDELNIALRYDYLQLNDVLTIVTTRPPSQHVVITGRNAPKELVAVADLVTEMALVKHPFRKGVRAQPGIEY